MITFDVYLQSISPGIVRTDIIINAGASRERSDRVFSENPCLDPIDVANALLYALSTPPHVQVIVTKHYLCYYYLSSLSQIPWWLWYVVFMPDRTYSKSLSYIRFNSIRGFQCCRVHIIFYHFIFIYSLFIHTWSNFLTVNVIIIKKKVEAEYRLIKHKTLLIENIFCLFCFYD
jgi:hypothetical protein